ncbi:MAG TPA: hypothetical protein VFF06_02005 [Polyangia bacterium]|nr:hypothetical protein [Polyangia bacterium]
MTTVNVNLSSIDLGPARLELRDAAKVSDMLQAGTLVLDARRTRALFFNGRFLAALDLTRERDYLLLRMADLARAGGTGVVTGLNVSAAPGATSVTITSGHGVTPAGELVVMPQDRIINIVDLPTIERLNAAFGLSQIPNDPQRSPTGLYVLALRPVEFTANPIASYPTSVSGARSTHDGDIIEAVAVTLVPYPENGAATNPIEARARAAQRIFTQDGLPELPTNSLPIAMLMLSNNTILWIDPFMVRREIGAEHEDIVGLGISPRALREAHMMQYDQHLGEVLKLRGQNGHFAAHDYFHALPPAGRMPAASIDPTDFSQLYFPSQVDVDLSVIPEDELPAMLEESLLLQPIDLTQPDQLESTSVLVLIPKPRAELRKLEGQLQSLQRTLKPVAPGLVLRRAPIDVLRGLLVGRPFTPVLDPTDAINAAWRTELAGQTMLYYVRRRHLNYKASVSGVSVAAGRDEVQDGQRLAQWMSAEGDPTNADFTALKARATAPAVAEMVYWLSSPEFQPVTISFGPGPVGPPISIDVPTRVITATPAGTVLPGRIIPPPLPVLTTTPLHPLSKVYLMAAVFDLKQIPGTPTRANVLDVEQLYADPDFGAGTARFAAGLAQPQADTLMPVLSQTGQLPAFDLVSRKLSDADLATFKNNILTNIMAEDPAKRVADLAAFIVTKQREVQS